MYKLVMFLFLLLLVSCDFQSYTKRVDVLEFKYKDHYYLRFRSPAYYGSDVVHSPDCPCYDKNLLLWQR